MSARVKGSTVNAIRETPLVSVRLYGVGISHGYALVSARSVLL
jgi:hypothetical protein